MAVKELQVDVEGDETIIVSKPGTEFLVGYKRRHDELPLVPTRSWFVPSI